MAMLPAQPPNSRRISGTREGDVQNMNLLGQDVILEPVLEDHDVVKGEGTTDQCRHDEKSGIKNKQSVAGSADVFGFDPETDGEFAIGRKCIRGCSRRQVVCRQQDLGASPRVKFKCMHNNFSGNSYF